VTEKALHIRYRWIILFVAVFGFILFNFALQSVPPILSDLQSIFGIDNSNAGLLMSLVVIPGIFLALPAGMLINKHGFRQISCISSILIAAGSIITASSSQFSIALVGRLIIGIGGCFLTIGAAVIIPQWFQPKEIGKAMGIYVAGVPIAVTLAFLSTPTLSQNFGWQTPFYLVAAASIASAIFFLAIIKDGPLKINSTKDPTDLKQALSSHELWKIGIIWMLFNMGAIGFLTWAPVMFVTYKGLSIVDASIFTSSIMIVNLFLVPIYGWVSDKLDRRKPFIIIGALITSILNFAISYLLGLPLIAVIILSGVSGGAVPGLVMAIAARTLNQKQAGISFGIMTMWQNVGITITAPVIGYILQASQSMVLTFASLSLISVVLAAITFTTKTK
jgi:predicted MFS family arabinose efflux permease